MACAITRPRLDASRRRATPMTFSTRISCGTWNGHVHTSKPRWFATTSAST